MEQSPRLTIFLTLDLSDTAPSGPGWYLRAFDESQPLMSPTPIATQAAYEASRALQEALQSTEGELPSLVLPQLVERSSEAIRRALEAALEKAETHAKKIGMYRKKLADFGPSKPPTS